MEGNACTPGSLGSWTICPSRSDKTGFLSRYTAGFVALSPDLDKLSISVAIVPPAHLYNVFDFTLNRRRDGPERFLADYRGYLHGDAFRGYQRPTKDRGGDYDY
jgi:hypothetical protein